MFEQKNKLKNVRANSHRDYRDVLNIDSYTQEKVRL